MDVANELILFWSGKIIFRSGKVKKQNLRNPVGTMSEADPGFGGRGGVNCHKQGRNP